MSKLTPPEKKKLEESLRYIPLPLMSYADDNLWIKSKLKLLPERYRQDIAILYTSTFFRKLHDRTIPELKRKGEAREAANALLRNIVDLYEKSNTSGYTS
ncbi:hypothetical protein RBA25_003990 [Cronobacter turicensis]|uniref:hypothetical protein n=1 Tax=Cronobacter sakazakii TaxID=28141 RepID=UPI0009BB9805|nr:hypothetical protein [Cronobacter sakazakii]EKY3179872.1 hypothetical protein [Cronobacter turicensis]ELY4007642.1 hypothetical protein [Cronobacter dublinensis]ELY3740510.1 hypothetical protein [Cronobacter sakazakii]ELY4410051.1 hypothetical protein [Cronobacter dublinensis]ELY4487592.1 hypothetical protein [Cronobacter dublinensis]